MPIIFIFFLVSHYFHTFSFISYDFQLLNGYRAVVIVINVVFLSVIIYDVNILSIFVVDVKL